MKLSRPSRKLHIAAGVFALLFASGLLFSQSPAPPPPPANQNPTMNPSLKVNVRLIQVTVIAEDGDGNPVSDLKKEDFTLRDQGQQQKIFFFAQQNTPASPAQPSGVAPANFYSNHVESNPAGANSVTILLFDALNTQFRNLSYARTRVISFLQNMQPQDQVALYFLTPSKLYVMHDFTNDSATLVRLMGGKPDAAPNSHAANTAPPNPNEIKIEKLLSDSFAASNSFYKGGEVNRLETTAEAMRQIAANVVNIPGRKNLVWISSGFPIAMGPAIPLGARDDGQDYTGTLSITAKQLGDANIAVYPVDARGLVAPRGSRIVSPNQDAMVLIASGTGGRPFFNTNDLASSIRKAVDDSRVSYVLGYYPTNDKWDNRFREINIKVARSGVHLRYRTGYLATPANPTNVKRNELLTSDAIRSPLQLIDLGLEVRAVPVATSSGRELKVSVRVDSSQMHFEKEGDHYVDAVEIVWAGMSLDARILDRDSKTVELRPTQTEYDEIQRAGVSFSQEIRLGNDATELRLIVRDYKTGAIGSVNIPLAGLFANIKKTASATY
jgi:VWFA-related protein